MESAAQLGQHRSLPLSFVKNHGAERQSGEAMAMIPGSCSSRLGQQSQGETL